MTRIRTSFIASITLVALGLLPLAAYAQSTDSQGLNTQGVLDCNLDGAYSVSSGVMAAIGGTYVPVNDAAVTLTTGYLVYKECVLNKIAARMRENATASLVKQAANQFQTGKNGDPMYVVNLPDEEKAQAQAVMDKLLSDGASPLASLSDDMKIAIGRDFARQQNPGNQAFVCSYSGSAAELSAIQHGQGSGGMSDVLVLADPNCNPLGQYINAQAYAANVVATDRATTRAYLDWSQGVYPMRDANGNVLTPGFLVAGTIQQQLGSGFRQQESANDINQMVGSLFAGIGNALISQAAGGLRGLLRGAGGNRSYLDLVVQNSASGLRDSAVNAGLQVLVAARQSQAAYLAAKQATGALLLQKTAELRNAESACWDLVVPAAMNYAATGGCTAGVACSGSFSIKVATSTAFSQGVINAHIAPLAGQTTTAIASSTAALATIDQILAGVTAASSPTTQSAALQQLDGMVARGELKNQYDAQAAQQQAQDVQGLLQQLVTDTAKLWGDSPLSATDPSSGWCNVNNPDVAKMWALKWKL